MNRLRDVDVDGVHLVGAPANRRPFAIVKGLVSNKKTDHSGGDQTVKLAEILKAAGLSVGDDEATKKALEGDVSIEKLIEAAGAEAVAKALGVELPKKKKTVEIDKSKLDDDVKAYVAKLESTVKAQGDAIDEIVKGQDADKKGKLDKRIEVLVTKGIVQADDDGKPPEMSATQVTAHEEASERFDKLRKELGILDMKGTDELRPDSATAAVAAEVRKILGREPKDVVEESKVRREIYRANPGLLRSITKEERQAAG